ncbi:MAG: class I SAM-dependent methyltransferase [Gammaproteobacteria bacterium]|nr:class I SAM-dependent methyltransferase [Gammaproteobacteria bacterium]MBU0787637.1 class I SAM-dependent methyltransferase [Gammaproteobacteria bacterium]MBU0814893.1 class I SAM-dependent methyltransferase [Gammaproteobacteria bacterium]MBU1785999.1 class I SAM-dependent methyltransferase [Gammaproteobacteria bacterium]
MATERPPTIDPVAAERWHILPATPSPWLHEEVARRMEERLGWIKLKPANWVHWEPLRGGVQAHRLLTQRYPGASCHVIEPTPALLQAARQALSQPWWSPARWRAAPVHFEVPPQASVQMLWANMALHMAVDPQQLIAQWHRLLAVDGFVMFSCLGPDTLRGLRSLYESLGWPAPAHEFTDMHDWGDMLVNAGFAEPVMDMERITLTFASPERLLQELRELGRNLHTQRFAGLRGRQWHRQLREEMSRRLANPQQQGSLGLEFEVIYGHALKPVPRLKVQAQSTVTLDEMRTVLQKNKPGQPQG